MNLTGICFNNVTQLILEPLKMYAKVPKNVYSYNAWFVSIRNVNQGG